MTDEMQVEDGSVSNIMAMSRPKNEQDLLYDELYDLCKSDGLSLDALCEKLNQLEVSEWNSLMHGEYGAYDYMPFFHRVCMNKNVTLDIIEYLLDVFPDAARSSGDVQDSVQYYESPAYPLHACCYNEHCPSSIIQILLEKYPEALSSFSFVGEGVNSGVCDHVHIWGLPIHYYLSRNSNVDIYCVRMMVETNPDCLTASDSHPCTAIQSKYWQSARDSCISP